MMGCWSWCGVNLYLKLNDEIKKELDYQLKDALYKDNVINELSKQVLDLEYKLNHSL